jgi:wyosine [tRNA(Phe)-imidazoG37] synthetase (radical SAM superfamily)
MFKYLFGPVPSRRLGMSLGIDLIPKKVCSLNCVYCEVGETTKLTTERTEYILHDKIEQELKLYFKNSPDPDYFTFSGSGEPTLNSILGKLIKFLKKHKPEIPVAVLTNGTLLHKKKVRDELKKADLVLPSLDAVTDEVFQKINRPASNILINEYIQGLVDFSKEFQGEIWLEVFILPGYNDSEKELSEFKQIIRQINPNQIQLNTLDRPGIIPNLKPADHKLLKQIADDWGDNVSIIASPQKRKNTGSYMKDIESTIIQTISRRPCTTEDIVNITGMHINEINKYLDVLEDDNKIESKRQNRGVFYQIKDL